MNERILVVDDEPKIVRLARDYLERDGLRVISAGDGPAALAAFHRERPDLVVLDIMLPGMSGWEVCRALRRESDVPIIMLTARSEESDQVLGLELGADDYVSKPFSPRALTARVRALLRRAAGQLKPPSVLRSGTLEIDSGARRTHLAGREVHLTPTEFELLVMLVRSGGQTLSREQLMDGLHGAAIGSFDRSIDSHIKNLRRKLESDPANPQMIETVYAAGYRFRPQE